MKENGKYRILQSCYWMMINVAFGYTTFYLGGYGYSAGEVGILTAVFAAISAVCQPLLGRAADRSKRFNWKVILIMLSAACGLDLILLAVFKAKLLVGLLFGLMALLMNCMMPMINAACFYYEKRGVHVDFGIARGMGSMFYAVVSMILGWLTVRIGTSAIPLAGIPILAVLFLTVCFMPLKESGSEREDAKSNVQIRTSESKTSERKTSESKTSESEISENKTSENKTSENKTSESETSENKTSAKKAGTSPAEEGSMLKKYPAFSVMILGSALLMSVHTFMTTYLLQILEQIGGNTGHLGIALAIGAVAEVPILFLFSHIIKRYSAARLLVICSFFYIIKSMILLFAGSIGLVYAAHLLQPLSYALYVSAIVYFTDESMQEDDKVTGQSLMTMTSAVGSVVGNLLGGWLIDFGGVTVMMMFCVILAVAAAGVVAVSVMMHGRTLKKSMK